MNEAITVIGTRPKPRLTSPRLRLMVNGTAIPALSAEINSNNYFHADAFKAALYLYDPDLIAAKLGAQFWCADSTGSSANPVMVTVQIDPGLTQTPNWTDIITGRVDHIDFDPITGELMIDGRDRTADFIETKTFATYRNLTSSQIAQKLAANHGMTAQVTATTTPVERYYATDHDKITLNDFTRVTTEWDLLTFLAQQEGFDVFVSANTLYFQPATPPGDSPVTFRFDPQSQPWIIANGIKPRLKRALTLARDIQVTVQTWSSKTASSFHVTAKATGTKSASAGMTAFRVTAKPGATTTQNYVYTRPNLTHDQAQNLANQKLAELSAHERVVELEIPGEVGMTPRQGLRIKGTGTDFDMDYYITEISRTIDHEGFTQTVTAKNSSPKDTSIVG